MAEFTINIEEEELEDPGYHYAYTNIFRENCYNPINETWGIRLFSDTGQPAIIDGYSGEPWNILRVSLVYSVYGDFVIYYQGIPFTVPIGGHRDIFIYGIAPEGFIPDLELRAINADMSRSINVADLSFKIIDVNGLTKSVNNTAFFRLSPSPCTSRSNPAINNVVSASNILCSSSTGQAVTFTIIGEPNSTNKFQIATTSNGTSGYNGVLKNVDNNMLLLPAQSPGTGTTVDGSYTLNSSGIINLHYEVCAIEPSGGISENCVEVSFTLYKDDGITIDTSQRINLAPCAYF